MDLQDVLTRLNDVDRQARTGGVNAGEMLETVRDLIADTERALGADGSTDDHDPPTIETTHQLLAFFARRAEAAGLEIVRRGSGWSNGPLEDAEIRFPNGFEAFVQVSESEDDEYLIRRYEDDDETPAN